MVRRSSTTSRGTGSLVFALLCPGYLVCACAIFLTWCAYQDRKKKKKIYIYINKGKRQTTFSIRDLNLHGFQHGNVKGKPVLIDNLIDSSEASEVENLEKVKHLKETDYEKE